MNGHSAIVTNAVTHWSNLRASIGGAAKPTPLTVLNAIAGLSGVDAAAKSAARRLRRDIPEATLHWNQQNLAFTQAWNAVGPAFDSASTAAAMLVALKAAKDGGAPVKLDPAMKMVKAGQTTVYDPTFVAAQPATGNTADVAQLLRTGVKGAVKGVVGANGTPAEAVAVVASLEELVDQLW